MLIFGYGSYALIIEDKHTVLDTFETLFPIIVLLVFYAGGLLATYRSHRIGLLIVGDYLPTMTLSRRLSSLSISSAVSE
jgi:hypothetical protein